MTPVVTIPPELSALLDQLGRKTLELLVLEKSWLAASNERKRATLRAEIALLRWQAARLEREGDEP